MWSFLTSAAGVRLLCFAGVFLALAVWEMRAPRRQLSVKKPGRWASNLGLVILNSVLLRFVAPLGLVGVAWFADAQRWGLLHHIVLHPMVAGLIAFVALDFAVYIQHVLFHAVPLLWRLHMVHHADLDFDVTTGLRFHTVEILVSFVLKGAVVLLLGAPVLAVLIFEIVLNATSMFNHSNVRIPLGIDRLLRWLVVTPDMHRVHHSVTPRETNSNFGFNLPWWDRLLGTYRDQPEKGHDAMTIGLSSIRDERQADRLHRMLLLPLKRPEDGVPISQRGETDNGARDLERPLVEREEVDKLAERLGK